MDNKNFISDSLKQACLYYYTGLHYEHSVMAIKYLADESATEGEKLEALLTIYYMMKFHLFYPVMFNPETEATCWNNLSKFIKVEKKTKTLMQSTLLPFLYEQMEPLCNGVFPALKADQLWQQAEIIYKKDPNEFYRFIKAEFWTKPPSHMNKLVKLLEKEIKKAENRLDLIAM